MNPAAVFQQWRNTSPQHLRRRPLRSLLSLVSIAVAVALFVSMRITQASLIETFQANLAALAGGAQYTVTSNSGTTPAMLAAMEAVPGVRAAPIVQGAAILTGPRQTVMVIGVDAVRDAKLRSYTLESRVQLDLRTLLMASDAAIVPRSLADRYGWALRTKVDVTGPNGPATVSIAGILTSDGPAAAMGGNILFMPLPAAQRLLNHGKTFDRIDAALDPPATAEAVRAALPTSATLQPARGADPTFEYLYSQFQTMLGTVSVFAALIGVFIVFNSVSLSVVERTREIGTLRALGAQRGELLAVFAMEAALLGLVASLLGVLGGHLAARTAIGQIAQSIRIILDLGEMRMVVPADTWFVAPLVGMATAVAGAFWPARTAVSLPPVVVLRQGAGVRSSAMRGLTMLAAAIPLALLSVYVVQHPRTNWQLTVGGILGGMVAVALAGPQIVAALSGPARRAARRWLPLPAYLALDNIAQFPSRTSLTTVAFGGSLSLVVAVAGTVQALEKDVTEWMDDLFVFDLSMQMNDLSGTAYATGAFPPEVYDEVRRDAECGDAYGVRIRLVPFRGEEVMLIAYDCLPFQRARIAKGLSRDGFRDEQMAASLQRGEVAVSPNFSRLHHVQPGDSIELPTPASPRSFKIACLQTDHSWFRGVVIMDLEAYRSLWNDRSLNYLDILTKPGTDVEKYRAELTQRWAVRLGVFVHRADEIKRYGRRFIHDWFALINIQMLLAIVIGGVGVANTLLISVLTQSRQIGLLRAVGASTGQIRRMLLTEAGFLGLLSGLAGCVMGMVTVRYLVVPMALKASGELLPLVIPYGTMAAALAGGVAIALASALLPLRAAGRLDVVRAIGYE